MGMQQKSDEMRWIPERLGKYDVQGKLGQGGMGDIYKAVQEPLKRTVALKVLPPNLSQNIEFSKRFETEAKAISLLQHQNIVSIYEYGEEHGLKYFAMQFVEGTDLARRITKKKTLTFPEAIDISKQICRGLRYAHSVNVIHRDIKPQNILIDKSGVCLISDFGIAKIFQSAGITMTGMAVGTPEYMSPEQAEGGSLDIQTDIYSLGILIYEMVTGRPPFTGENPVAIAYKQVHETPVPPSAYRKDIPKRLELIILKALKKNKTQRYRSIEELLHDLDTVDINEKTDRPTVSITRRKASGNQNKQYTEKRITDRRSGDRRRRSSGSPSVFSADYWIEAVQNQALSLILIAILAVILAMHLLTHAH